MHFEFADQRMYLMPVVFGPAITPRQNPDGNRFMSGRPETTHYKVVLETAPEQLVRILPNRFELLSPHIILTFSALRNLPWLAGRGYDIVHVEIPVRFAGQQSQIIGNFEPVLWENLTEAIITGREQLGYSKLFGQIGIVEEDGISMRGTISTFDFPFLDIHLDYSHPPEDMTVLRQILQNKEISGKLHYKYMPRTGDNFLAADANYVTYGAADWNPPIGTDLVACPNEASFFCSGSAVWHKPSWEEAPTQSHIIQYFCNLNIRRFVGAQKQVVHSLNDLYHQQIVT